MSGSEGEVEAGEVAAVEETSIAPGDEAAEDGEISEGEVEEVEEEEGEIQEDGEIIEDKGDGLLVPPPPGKRIAVVPSPALNGALLATPPRPSPSLAMQTIRLSKPAVIPVVPAGADPATVYWSSALSRARRVRRKRNNLARSTVHGADADAEGLQADGEEGVIDDEELPIAPAFPENVPVVTTTCGDFEGAIRSLAAMYSNYRRTHVKKEDARGMGANPVGRRPGQPVSSRGGRGDRDDRRGSGRSRRSRSPRRRSRRSRSPRSRSRSPRRRRSASASRGSGDDTDWRRRRGDRKRRRGDGSDSDSEEGRRTRKAAKVKVDAFGRDITERPAFRGSASPDVDRRRKRGSQSDSEASSSDAGSEEGGVALTAKEKRRRALEKRLKALEGQIEKVKAPGGVNTTLRDEDAASP